MKKLLLFLLFLMLCSLCDAGVPKIYIAGEWVDFLTVKDHGDLTGLTGQGAGGGANDHGLGSDDSPTFAGASFTGTVTVGDDVTLSIGAGTAAGFTWLDGTSIFAFGTIGELRTSAASHKWRISTTEQMNLTDGVLAPTTDNDVDLGTSSKEWKDLFVDGTANIDSLVADTADINGGTLDAANIGQTTPGLVRGTKIEVDNNTTYIDKDGSNNMTFTDAVYGTKTLSEMGSPTMVDVSDTTVAEGYNNITSFNDKVLILYIEITTSSTDWTFTVVGDDAADSVAHPREIVSNRSGNYNIEWNYPYEDEDGTSEFHYRFEDDSGANTHNIRVLGVRLL